jgi:hypothetical protein
MNSFLEPVFVAYDQLSAWVASFDFIYNTAFWGYLFLVLWYEPLIPIFFFCFSLFL